MIGCEWAEPPRPPHLAPGEVHVWRACLNVGEAEFCRVAQALTPEEHAQASGFRFPADRRAFVVARAALRHILSRYLGESPSRLMFVRSVFGKPALAQSEARWLHFNVSHSQNLALYVVARDMDVGVDVEYIQPELANWKLASEFFADGEILALRQLGDELQTPAFFACWTRKEAYLKARGTGLSAALNGFQVPIDSNAAVAIVLDRPLWVAGDDGNWSLRPLPAGEGFAAACVAKGSDWRLHLWQWNPDDGVPSPDATD